jgi:hypothetical protein
MIHHPDVLSALVRERHAELLAAADEFRRARQARTPRDPRWRRRRRVTGADAVPSPARSRCLRYDGDVTQAVAGNGVVARLGDH